MIKLAPAFAVFSMTSSVGNIVVTIPVTSWSMLPDRSWSTVLVKGAFGTSFIIVSITCLTVKEVPDDRRPAKLMAGTVITMDAPAALVTVDRNFLLPYISFIC